MEVHVKDRPKNKFKDTRLNEQEFLEKNIYGCDGFHIETFGKKDKKFHTPKRKKAEKDWQDAI